MNMATRNTLPNGAQILNRQRIKDNDWVVLCAWGKEYVTWVCDNDGNASWGKYFRDTNFADAHRSFHNRVKERQAVA